MYLINLIKKKNWLINQPYWSVIEKYKGKTIITGSLALKAFGLLTRYTKDVDFIVTDKSIIEKELFTDSYNDEIDIDLLGYYGYEKTFFGLSSISPYFLHTYSCTVDFFENKSVTVIEKDGYLFQHPLEIIDTKVKIAKNRNSFEQTRYKDYEDFIYFVNVMEEKYGLK